MLDVVESRAELLQSRLQVVDLVSERTGALPLGASKERGKTDRRLTGRLLSAPEPLFERGIRPLEHDLDFVVALGGSHNHETDRSRGACGRAVSETNRMPDNHPRANPLEFTLRWPVRGYELDSNGHVNNAVYLSWAEELATAHAEAAGYGRDWSVSRGGGWVVRRTEITYHRPAVYGDEVELTVWVELVRGARAIRRTTITRIADRELLADVLTEWVWIRLSDGRPAPAPRELVELAAAVTAKTLAQRRR